MALAKTQYARSGDADIAYQVIGDGPRDLALVLDWANHLEAIAEHPVMDELLRSLTRFARVLWFDPRGIGMSGIVAGGDTPVETWVDDLIAVMDAADSREATLLAQGQAAQMGVIAAATHPGRVTSLVLLNGFARLARADDYPAGIPERVQRVYGDEIERQWGHGTLASFLGPSVAERPGVVEWWGRVERFGTSPRVARAKFDSALELDVRHVLPLVDVPTLVVHTRGNQFVRVDHGRYLAEHIPGARLVEIDSSDHYPLPHPELLGAVEEFVTGTRVSVQDTEVFLATVLFCDVVGSTAQLSDLGDRSWRVLLDAFHETSRRALALYAGELRDTAGDGILATFDGPARAIRCALRIRDDVGRAGLEVRAGLHAGEVSRSPDSISGLTVHIGARVSALADPGEVLVTRTVRDLVAGSGIAFEERGPHELKGVPDRWELYAATA